MNSRTTRCDHPLLLLLTASLQACTGEMSTVGPPPARGPDTGPRGMRDSGSLREDAGASRPDAAPIDAPIVRIDADGTDLCPLGGWCELPDTRLRDVCPPNHADYPFHDQCNNVVNAWNSGVADTARHRLVLWGGGHADYFGNELYALDLIEQRLVRLNDPTPPIPPSTPEEYPDGRPSSRHTYNSLVYLPELDEMFAAGGARWYGGEGSSWTWTYAFTADHWTHRVTSGDIRVWDYGLVTAYEPRTESVLIQDGRRLFRFDPSTNVYAPVSGEQGVDYHLTGALDTDRNVFVMVGGGQAWAIRLDDPSPTHEDWTRRLDACTGLRDVPYPGLAYDPTRGRIIGWAGYDTVYSIDVASESCTSSELPGGPGPQHGYGGTMGRFRYFPALDVFALVWDADENAFVLRLPR